MGLLVLRIIKWVVGDDVCITSDFGWAKLKLGLVNDFIPVFNPLG